MDVHFSAGVTLFCFWGDCDCLLDSLLKRLPVVFVGVGWRFGYGWGLDVSHVAAPEKVLALQGCIAQQHQDDGDY